MIAAAAALCGCGIYKPYTRPEIKTDDLYGAGVATADTLTLGDAHWREMFSDKELQQLIELGLQNNTDIRSAHLRVQEAEATLKSARLAYLPSFNFTPQGTVSSFDLQPAVKTYTVPVTASWQLDIFGGITNAKRRARALYEQSSEYRRAVRVQLISGIANLYYTLLMLDEQLEVSTQTVDKWRQSTQMMRDLKQAGMATEAAVAQYEGNTYAIEASLYDLKYQIRQVENSLCTLLGQAPHTIARGKLEAQRLPESLATGVPLQMLTNRPDIKAAEYSLMQAYYATAEARSALYPSITLSGTAGWTNSAGSAIVNPGKFLWSVVGQLVQPIFNAGAGRARVKIMKAQQEEARLAFGQALLNAGAEVNNALAQTQSARAKNELRRNQIAALERAVESTELLMRYSPTTYVEVLTAEQSLLAARLSQIADRFDELQGAVNLYRSLGGGRDEAVEAETGK